MKTILKAVLTPFYELGKILVELWDDKEFVFGLGFVFGMVSMLFILTVVSPILIRLGIMP